MTECSKDYERVIPLLDRLPEREFALYRLGAAVQQSFRLADINRTPADRAYVVEVAKRIYEVTSPEGRELFARWLKPGGVLRLWSE
jgi:hypothetical protein